MNLVSLLLTLLYVSGYGSPFWQLWLILIGLCFAWDCTNKVVHGNAGCIFVFSIAMLSQLSQWIGVFPCSICLCSNPFDVFWYLIECFCKEKLLCVSSPFFFAILLYLIVSSPLYFRSRGAFNILNHLSRFSKDVKVLLLDKVYVVNVLGTFPSQFFLH